MFSSLFFLLMLCVGFSKTCTSCSCLNIAKDTTVALYSQSPAASQWTLKRPVKFRERNILCTFTNIYTYISFVSRKSDHPSKSLLFCSWLMHAAVFVWNSYDGKSYHHQSSFAWLHKTCSISLVINKLFSELVGFLVSAHVTTFIWMNLHCKCSRKWVYIIHSLNGWTHV